MNDAKKLIGEMQMHGWTIEFPAFGDTRALAVVATKGNQRWQKGWVPNHAGSFDDAIQRLHSDTLSEQPLPSQVPSVPGGMGP